MDITENNEVGAIVANITLGTGVTLELKPNPNNFFTLEGNQLKAAVVFDYEVPQITLTATDGIHQPCVIKDSGLVM